MPELDDPDVNEEEEALLPEIEETVFTDPVEPRRIELGVSLVKLAEPEVNLDPLDELSEEPADTDDDPMADPVLKDEDPWLEPTLRDADALLSAELDDPDTNEEEDFMFPEIAETVFNDPVEPLVKLDEPDANLDPLEELIEEPVDAEDDP